MKTTLEFLRANNLILLEAISGSHAYGLAHAQSDTDIRGVFYLPKDHFFGLEYLPQVSDGKNDVVFYELGRFVELLGKNNPNMLELLASPADCLLHRDPIMDQLQAEMVLSKLCKETFAGYAKAQVEKARGLKKKIVNPMEKERKTVLDFCHVVEGQMAIPVKAWLAQKGWRQEDCGLVKVDHMREVFALFHHEGPFEEGGRLKGIVQSENANDISLSSVPKHLAPASIMAFNKDGYSIYCKDYKAYWEWVELRNEARYATTEASGQGYDAKNMMHTFRLLNMAEEIAAGQLLVRRPERDFLMDIRLGKQPYEALLQQVDEKMQAVEAAFEASLLPEKPDLEGLETVLVAMRKQLYG